MAYLRGYVYHKLKTTGLDEWKKEAESREKYPNVM
jgi:hypothetical protein